MGRMMALATRYEVSTQVASSTLAERLPAMCGRETLTTVVSSTSMKVANMTAVETIHGLTRGYGSTADGIRSLVSMMPQICRTAPASGIVTEWRIGVRLNCNVALLGMHGRLVLFGFRGHRRGHHRRGSRADVQLRFPGQPGDSES